QMSAPTVVIIEIASRDPFQMALVQYDNVIQTFSADASDHSFHVSVLPRAPWSR
ncbi:MAG: hypothetical protein ACI8XZ_002773, partial [Gammaproteobacteria bacterium]